MLRFGLGWFALTLLMGCQVRHSTPDQIDTLMDAWHVAAAKADFDAYFNLMHPESIFMGTDASEYWTRAAFMDYAKPYFNRGKAWTFKPFNRHVYFSPDGNTAWFDEELDTENMGLCRGSGVAQFHKGTWLIMHYNLSLPIPNDRLRSILPLIKP